ncbi:MAG: hypothetical protein IT290_08565, partial [Deltaproteobacteria bacterium]|nr:hypothetical protein [Deltaproteobacteria bacterium]
KSREAALKSVARTVDLRPVSEEPYLCAAANQHTLAQLCSFAEAGHGIRGIPASLTEHLPRFVESLQPSQQELFDRTWGELTRPSRREVLASSMCTTGELVARVAAHAPSSATRLHRFLSSLSSPQLNLFCLTFQKLPGESISSIPTLS